MRIKLEILVYCLMEFFLSLSLTLSHFFGVRLLFFEIIMRLPHSRTLVHRRASLKSLVYLRIDK